MGVTISPAQTTRPRWTEGECDGGNSAGCMRLRPAAWSPDCLQANHLMKTAIEKTHALVLRVVPFSRTSHVVTWLTATDGVLTTLIKGACRPKSMFLGQYDLFYTCELLFYHRARNGLHIARECAPLALRPALRTDWKSCACASYACDLVARTGTSAPRQRDLYRMLESVLNAACRQTAGIPLMSWFELQLMDLLGFAPRLWTCSACKTRLRAPGTRRFSPADGGILCASCGSARQEDSPRLQPAALAMLRHWQQSDSPRAAQHTACSSTHLQAVHSILGLFLEYHFDILPKSRSIALQLMMPAGLRSAGPWT